MTSFSAFARFGHASFTGRELPGKIIYDSMKNALGDGFSDEFNGSHTQAKLFAQAMALASTVMILDRVRNNGIAKKVTDLLETQESIHGITPSPQETKFERRAKLHSRMQVARGGRYEAIWEIMTTLLGADFLSWTVADIDSLLRFPDTVAEARLVGNFVPPGTEARVIKLLEPAMPGTRTVMVEELTSVVSDAVQQNLIGRKALADPQSNSRADAITIDDATFHDDGAVESITATFTQPHDTGSLITTQYFPMWRSSAHQHFFELSASIANDPEKRRKVDDELKRALKSIALWDLGVPGPFLPGEGLVGVTAFTETIYAPKDPIVDIIGSKLAAYWGADPADWKNDVSGNDYHLVSVGAAAPVATSIDGTMAALIITDDVELENDDVPVFASGTNNSFAVVCWAQDQGGLPYFWEFYNSGGSASHRLSSESGTGLRVRRVNDAGTPDSDAEATPGSTERFFAHSFLSSGVAGNIRQIDATSISSPVSGNPTTFDKFRIKNFAATPLVVARMIVANADLSQAELTAIRNVWLSQANWS